MGKTSQLSGAPFSQFFRKPKTCGDITNRCKTGFWNTEEVK
jgi:hypothetical protein